MSTPDELRAFLDKLEALERACDGPTGAEDDSAWLTYVSALTHAAPRLLALARCAVALRSELAFQLRNAPFNVSVSLQAKLDEFDKAAAGTGGAGEAAK